MDNPFEKLFNEIEKINRSLEEIKQRLPEEQEIKHYSPQDLADNTPMSVQTIRSKIKEGVINAKQLGRKYFITAEEFNRVCKDAKSLKYKRKGSENSFYIFHNLETNEKIRSNDLRSPKNPLDEMKALKYLNTGEWFLKEGDRFLVYTE